MREILIKKSWVSWFESSKRKQRPISVFIKGKEFRISHVISSFIHQDFQEFNIVVNEGFRFRIIAGEEDKIIFPVPSIPCPKLNPSIEAFSLHSFPLFPEGSVLFSHDGRNFMVSAPGSLQWAELIFWVEEDPGMRKILLGEVPTPFISHWEEKDVEFSLEDFGEFFSIEIPLSTLPLPREFMRLRVSFKYNGLSLIPDFLRDEPFGFYSLYFE